MVFLHSYANAAHELAVRRIAEQVAPDLHVTLSHEILPEYREYERAMTAVVNTYISPSVSRSLADFEVRLRSAGVSCAVNIVRSDGGLMSSQAASVRPVETIISGPSGGVAGALAVATAAGFDDILTLDMGGTSTDVSLCTAAVAQISRDTVVGDVPVRSPSLDVRSIGAGGGSIAFVPELLRGLRVGPRSAGAEPGPVCYGRGGTEPTVTDANVVLGRLPAGLLGGEITLDRDAAERALSKLGSPLGLTAPEAAQAVVDIANEKMAGALRIMSVERGLDPRSYALVAFGGAGPLHGNALAALLGCYPVLVPPAPGVLSAYGIPHRRASQHVQPDPDRRVAWRRHRRGRQGVRRVERPGTGLVGRPGPHRRHAGALVRPPVPPPGIRDRGRRSARRRRRHPTRCPRRQVPERAPPPVRIRARRPDRDRERAHRGARPGGTHRARAARPSSPGTAAGRGSRPSRSTSREAGSPPASMPASGYGRATRFPARRSSPRPTQPLSCIPATWRQPTPGRTC